MNFSKLYFKILIKNPISILLYVGIFALLAIINSYSLKDSKEDMFDYSNTKIAIINESHDIKSMELKKYLGKNFKVLKIKNSEEVIKDSLISNYVEYVLKIDKDNKMTYYSYGNEMAESDVAEKINEFENGSVSPVDVNLKLSESEKNLKIQKSMYYYYNFLLFTITEIILFAAYDTQRKLKSKEVISRVEVSGVKISKYKRKIYNAYFVVAISIWMIFTALAVGIYGKENMLEIKGIQFALANLIYIIPISAVGCLLSEFISEPKAVNAAINASVLILSFISGIFVPLKYFPPFLEKIAIISPMYWASKVNVNILDNNFYSANTALIIGIEILMAILVLIVYYAVDREKSY